MAQVMALKVMKCETEVVVVENRNEKNDIFGLFANSQDDNFVTYKPW